MRLWDFFLKKTITQENSIIVILAIVLEWNTNKEDGDCKSPGGSGRTFFDSGLQIRWNAWRKTFWLRISQSAWRVVLEWNTNKEDGDCKSPGGKWSNIFWQRIANPLERLAGDLLIENQAERLAEDFLIENQPERLAEDFQIENPLERLAGDFLIEDPPECLTGYLLIENPPERLAGDFLIVRWTNNTTPKRAVFWFKSTITTI